MADNLQRPKFLPSFFKTIGEEIDRHGVLRSAPWWLLVCAGAGAGCAYVVPVGFYGHLEVSAVVYVGVLTLNALILALSWSAFSRIHELLAGEAFGAYLLEANLLNGYIFYIDYVQLTQVVSIVCSGAGLIILLSEPSRAWINEAAFGLIVATVSYSIKTAAAAVSAMHDLVWQKAVFDKEMQDRRNGSDKVVRIKPET